MKNDKWKRSLFVPMLVISLIFGMAHPCISAAKAGTKAQLSVTVKIDAKKVNKKTITVKKGSSKKIKLSLAPKRSGMKIKYQSNKKSIVSVSKTGALKAKKAGTAKITVTVSGRNVKKTKRWFKVKVTRQSTPAKKTNIPVRLTVNGQNFKAIFYNNKTAKAILKKMPMTLTMKELNGNEKYYFFDTEFPTNEKSPGKISAGEIKLYGTDCLVTFYKSHRTSYQYTSVGKIENAAAFAKAVGSGKVTITFTKRQ